MSSLFKVKPSGLGIGNTDTSWEVVEMQNLGDIIHTFLIMFCGIHPLTSLKQSTLNRSGSPSSTASSLSDMQIVAGIPGNWGVLELGLVRD